jgi:hypothetical protein
MDLLFEFLDINEKKKKLAMIVMALNDKTFIQF